ncbi:rhomboid family intramembrane serine protease [Limisalsivibrio acetivorans]|uniref:rhomboid family intramembrane serine protease n=1 Tax=Limisalsivibrio acetivorans TaxID=1304888 RepID=UPI0003FA26C3|nr:rhomboid family intramembrane serine protease [Limisalsivibrio acetivorans]
MLIFVYQPGIGPEKGWYFYEYGLIPKRVLNPDSFVLDSVRPIFTSMFIHGNFMHILGNMYFLFIFGDNIEDRLGHFKYILAYLGLGLFAAVTQVIMFPGSTVPMVGASGAVAGVMGAYLIFYPHAKVKTLLIIIFFITFVDIPAVIFLLLWFFIQFMNGSAAGTMGSGVAWWAHVGGFVGGLALAVWVAMRKNSELGVR